MLVANIEMLVEGQIEVGALVFAGGLEEEIELANDSKAKLLGAKVGKACWWPQEISKFKE